MNPTMTAFRALVRKDIAIFLRDRRALVVSVLTPIVVAAFFGFLFAGPGSGGNLISRMKVGITDLDQSALTKAVIESLSQDDALDIQLLPEAAGGTVGACRQVARGHGISGAVRVAGDRRLLGVRADAGPQASLRSLAVHGPADGGGTGHSTRHATAVAPDFVGNARPVPFNLENVPMTTGPRYNSYAHSFAGMSIQFILFMGIDAGIALLMMRQEGMWRSLRAAPLSRVVLLGSRVVGHHADRGADPRGCLPGGRAWSSACASPAACRVSSWLRSHLHCLRPPPD